MTMDSQDVSSERERLQGTLTQVRQQILHKWLGKDLTDKHGNHHRLQQEFAKLMEDSSSTTKSHIESCQQLMSKKEKMRLYEHKQAAAKELAADDIQALVDRELQERERLTKDVEAAEQQNTENRQALLRQQERVEQKRCELQKAFKFFKDRLGLQFKKISGNRLQVIYLYLDERNPERNAFFCLRIKDDRSYEVTDCEPWMEELPSLVEKLNNCNSLRSFIITMRQRFKKML